MKTLRKRSKRATTLTELLVVLAIISLLATLAVPVYLTQLSRARISIAQSEVRSIAEAEQSAAIAHGFLVPIHILDNVPNRVAGEPVGSIGSRDDFDNLTQAGNHFLVDVYSTLTSQIGSQLTLSSSDRRVTRMVNAWQGPFLNPRRVRYEGEIVNDPSSGDITIDLVADPWGNPYRMYSDMGPLFSEDAPTGSQVLPPPDLQQDDMFIQQDEADRFDRFAVISFGPDGRNSWLSSDPLDQGDDIYYTFSVIQSNETLYSNF
ncbi:type II secretion system protein [Candidatus Sumerlaeota bacterium]|nr:type II secretion system protein [Candidatus Sumerlaeota bacterium]